jgi:hypothetical protein
MTPRVIELGRLGELAKGSLASPTSIPQKRTSEMMSFDFDDDLEQEDIPF